MAQEKHNETVAELLSQFGISDYENAEFIDSSHGEEDVRHNYIIDKKYVLRINSAKVMTEERIEQLNTLIHRYRAFGMKAPLFLEKHDGSFIVEQNGQYCYLSEYLDYKLADDVKDRCRKELIEERVIFVARFAERFKNVDLIETVSMYSIFDLSPYDQLTGLGIDEKQDNLNHLVEDLGQAGETELAAKLAQQDQEMRRQLKAIYKELPRCVFQGDENFSNLCVDENDHIIGLFDFNMSGTEVIANYLANIAFQGNFYYTDEILEQHTAAEVFQMIMESYWHSTDVISQCYSFTEQEIFAYRLYSKIVMTSGYVNQAAFSEYLKGEKPRHKVIELLNLIYECNL